MMTMPETELPPCAARWQANGHSPQVVADRAFWHEVEEREMLGGCDCCRTHEGLVAREQYYNAHGTDVAPPPVRETWWRRRRDGVRAVDGGVGREEPR
jgi:hypothetical protein